MPSRMGEVRARAKLTNTVDEELVQRGLLTPDHIRTRVEDALVDTGAVRTVLPAQVAADLGLGTSSQEIVQYADGRTEAVNIVGPITVELEGRRTFEDAFVLGDEVLIGQTVLEKLDLLVDCQRQQLIPNPKHPNGPVHRV